MIKALVQRGFDFPQSRKMVFGFKDLGFMANKTFKKCITPNGQKLFLFYTGCPLSQFFPCEFYKASIKYTSAEQFMMAHKAMLFEDEVALEKILETDKPSKAKSEGRRVKNFDQLKWDQRKEGIVYEANLLKFGQGDEFSKFLEDTQDAILAEASFTDEVWGIGMRLSDTDAENPEFWSGQNLLGKNLMKVRQDLFGV